MKQYLDLLSEIYHTGEYKGPARAGMPSTKELFCRQMRFDLKDGFPLLTTKKMYTKAIVTELLWMISGNTNIRYLLENNNNIWTKDCYKFYKRRGGVLPMDKWLENIEVGLPESIEEGISYPGIYGTCGNIYGHQWRYFGGIFDQIQHLMTSLKATPDSRYHIITAWDPRDYFMKDVYAALPACHILYQFCVSGHNTLNMVMVQRSCDFLLGVPFDIASGALLLSLIAKTLGYTPGEFIWSGHSCHIYENHFKQVEEQLSRKPKKLCQLEIKEPKPIDKYTIDDIKFIGYESWPAIKAELSVGI